MHAAAESAIGTSRSTVQLAAEEPEERHGEQDLLGAAVGLTPVEDVQVAVEEMAHHQRRDRLVGVRIADHPVSDVQPQRDPGRTGQPEQQPPPPRLDALAGGGRRERGHGGTLTGEERRGMPAAPGTLRYP